uniref:Isopenicillin N synthase family oxygenase n=1 Tax=Phenylobacterium glaciei TaxID=2803784 RepID=A0A974P256_9CAUL|nr:isopenicillin N synthase family oxygenase [Phenylobacterium glaciei]
MAVCEGLCLRLLAAISAGLGADPQALAPAFEGVHTSFLRLNHYPTRDPLVDEAAAPAGLGIHHHTDAGAITLLLTDGVPGLQVLKDGTWRPVDPVPGGLIVNVGDMVQVWSNDAYQAPCTRCWPWRKASGSASPTSSTRPTPPSSVRCRRRRVTATCPGASSAAVAPTATSPTMAPRCRSATTAHSKGPDLAVRPCCPSEEPRD